jgi:hypothetical protein
MKLKPAMATKSPVGRQFERLGLLAVLEWALHFTLRLSICRDFIRRAMQISSGAICTFSPRSYSIPELNHQERSPVARAPLNFDRKTLISRA